ncbi:NACHT domain-containing protein [Xanthomonas phaseoli]|uniref:NACHT domain-containing protein n=1 Tax=Xanthomonas phaseoli TaxID=1985254 RepID=UPI003AFFAF4D
MTLPSERLAKINSLTDEVHDFHPLLNVLFARLPFIKSVEYRQGSREMGSDFVLERYDETLQSTEYVGVIVKTGKIRQDHAEVQRQIEECELERTFGAGKKKVYLSEVWVVSNDGISQGAQDKINHKYKNKSIKFISGEKVLELINKFYSEYWTDVSVKIGEYFRRIESSAMSMALRSAEIGISGAKIERDLIEHIGANEYQGRRKRKRHSMSSVLKQNRFTLIEASMGAGKSTLLADAASQMATAEYYNSHGTIPIFATVRDVVETYSHDVSELVSDAYASLDIDEQKCVVFLDGFDELKIDAEDQLAVLKKIKSSVENVEGVSIVISSRPLALKHDQALSKDFSRYSLPPFTTKQVITLVDSICNNHGVVKRLTKDLEKSSLFKVLPKTPISAILLAKLLKENFHEIPSTMTELYGKYMELVMGRWDMSKGLQSQTEYEVLQSVTTAIAKYALDNSLDHFSVLEAKEMFNDYIGSRNLKIDGEKTFEKMISRSEVFYLSADRGVMAFRHRTFAEFFYAHGMERLPYKELNAEVLKQYWANVYFFYFGLKKDASDLVGQLSALEVFDEESRVGKMMALPNMLLAAYLTPYGEITKAVSRYFDEVTVFYKDIAEGKSPESVFTEFSLLDLCCIFTKVTSSVLGYEFFLKALKECAEDVYSSPDLDQNFAVTKLFFVNSALAAIGYEHAYETYIKDYGVNIPIQFRVGIMEHSKEVDLKSDIVARYSKNLEKRLRSEIGMNQLAKDALKPISQVLRLK